MILILLACHSQKEPSSELSQAKWSPDEMWTAYDDLLEIGLPNVYVLFGHFQTLYDEGGNTDCPGTNYNFDSPDVQDNGCMTENGYFFGGAAEVVFDNEGWSFSCDCRIDTPDGRSFEGAGNILRFNQNTNGVDEQYDDIRGTFLTNFGPEWLQLLPSSVLGINQSSGILISGGYTLEGTSVYFNNISFDDCEYGFGRLDVRDPSGGWWYFERSDDCSEEGTLSFNSEVIAEKARKDLRPLLAEIIIATGEGQ